LKKRVERLAIWEGLDSKRWEVAHITLWSTGVTAEGTQVGVEPLPYRLDYTLDASDGFVTRALDVRVHGEGWRRRLLVRHDGSGFWEAEATAEGRVNLPAPEPAVEGLSEARDCDLGLSPLTNLMPLNRLGLLTKRTSASIVVAWVSVPELVLRPYHQRYEHIAVNDRGATVRFIDEDLFAGFTADLQLDPGGIVQEYPQLARRVRPDQLTN
jgi:uncharacterized protein